jgi:esterase/lipase superfamily enzyme
MITDRSIESDGLGTKRSRSVNPLSWWVSDGGPPDKLSSWKKVSASSFQNSLAAAADQFPAVDDPALHEDQKHVTLFIHGYNNDWKDAALRYDSICKSLFAGDKGLGLCVLFTWPSNGRPTDYLADRSDARACAPDLANVFYRLYDWLLKKQKDAAEDPKAACRAKTSVIAHSMGNYLLQNAMHQAWTRANQPLLVSLVNQCLMVAADVDNDLFGNGETTDGSDGDGIANLSYRVTAFYTGRDPVLGVSAGLKHFGKRRLGRSGLDRTFPLPDNVWDVNCSGLIPADADNIHSAYFESPKVLELMREVLCGVDRSVLVEDGVAPG